MSSFMGHSLAAVTIYLSTEPVIKTEVSFRNNQAKSLTTYFRNVSWLFWLIIIASIPDLDYLVNAWQSSQNNGLRITHSVIFSLVAPIITLALLLSYKINGKKLWIRSLQLFLAALSHLVLDLCVGVTPLPLLYPIVDTPIKLPFGILPSAGKINLGNYYFYRNLMLEMGVLLPIFGLVCMWHDRPIYENHKIKMTALIITSTIFLICLCYFIQQNLALPR